MPRKPRKPKSGMRLFYLQRLEDESGVSGTGIVAEGVEWSNGRITINWLSKHHSLNIYDNIKEAIEIFGHNGQTLVEYYE